MSLWSLFVLHRCNMVSTVLGVLHCRGWPKGPILSEVPASTVLLLWLLATVWRGLDAKKCRRWVTDGQEGHHGGLAWFYQGACKIQYQGSLHRTFPTLCRNVRSGIHLIIFLNKIIEFKAPQFINCIFWSKLGWLLFLNLFFLAVATAGHAQCCCMTLLEQPWNHMRNKCSIEHHE